MGRSGGGSPFKTFDDHLRRFCLKKAKSSMTISRAELAVHGEKRCPASRDKETHLATTGDPAPSRFSSSLIGRESGRSWPRASHFLRKGKAGIPRRGLWPPPDDKTFRCCPGVWLPYWLRTYLLPIPSVALKCRLCRLGWVSPKTRLFAPKDLLPND